ncbi:MAG TPA: dihydrofolate reductase [Tissierellaceae bacterium]|nr:dihydrofolate reductase [Tissierellaceae bacterium]
MVCVGEKWEIGKNNELLFRIPEDLKRFKAITEGKNVVMGRKTLESLPNSNPLPNRNNFVITRNKDFSQRDVVGVNSISQFLAIANTMEELGSEVYVIGGGEIYKKLLPKCNTVLVTKVYKKIKDADTYFPNLDKSKEWEIIEESEIHNEGGLEYQFVKYERIEETQTA